MLNREKTWVIGDEDDTEGFVPGLNTFYEPPKLEIPDLVPNVRITLVEDPLLKASTENTGMYHDSAAFSDKTYSVDDPSWQITWNGGIVGSYERLDESAPHIHTFMSVEVYDFLIYPLLYIDMEETMSHFYIYEPDWSLYDEITLDENNMSTDTKMNFRPGTYEWLITSKQQTKPEVPSVETPTVSIPTSAQYHLDIDFSDDCQYINVTDVNPIVGENTLNFTVTAKGQNEAGKYQYEIHWWGWLNQYYKEIDYNTLLMNFDETSATENLTNTAIYRALMGDTENYMAELSCIVITIPAGAKNFDFTKTVETDTTLHMAKYKDILKFNTTFDGTNWNPF